MLLMGQLVWYSKARASCVRRSASSCDVVLPVASFNARFRWLTLTARRSAKAWAVCSGRRCVGEKTGNYRARSS